MTSARPGASTHLTKIIRLCPLLAKFQQTGSWPCVSNVADYLFVIHMQVAQQVCLHHCLDF